jgi:hypothetical protein
MLGPLANHPRKEGLWLAKILQDIILVVSLFYIAIPR